MLQLRSAALIPTMCVDTRTNRPDVETIASVIAHANEKDTPAVHGYSIDLNTARSILERFIDIER
jgi:hypothetical protein